MGLLDNLQPAQKQILMIGAPVVAVFAFSALRKPAAAPAATSTDTTGTSSTGALTTGWTMPSTDAIGTGQLADFESSLTGGLNNLSTQVATVTDLVANPPPPPPPQPAPPAPQSETGPVIQPVPCSPPTGWPGAAGEVIIGHLNAPGGGCWWFSNYGGVANVGGAPFKGSATPYRFGPGYENPPRLAVSANPMGSGYQIWSNRSEHYDFP